MYCGPLRQTRSSLGARRQLARRRQLNFEGVAEPVAIGGTARAILRKTVDDGVADLDMAKAIRLDLIEPDPDQPRKHFDEEALRELAQSIRSQGVLQPSTDEGVPERDRFRIISVERRRRSPAAGPSRRSSRRSSATPVQSTATSSSSTRTSTARTTPTWNGRSPTSGSRRCSASPGTSWPGSWVRLDGGND